MKFVLGAVIDVNLNQKNQEIWQKPNDEWLKSVIESEEYTNKS